MELGGQLHQDISEPTLYVLHVHGAMGGKVREIEGGKTLLLFYYAARVTMSLALSLFRGKNLSNITKLPRFLTGKLAFSLSRKKTQKGCLRYT